MEYAKMSCDFFRTGPYKIGDHKWRLVIAGSPKEGYYTRWQFKYLGRGHWREALSFPFSAPAELAQITETELRPVFADYRLTKSPTKSAFPDFYAKPFHL